jgi:hypothetical protein
MIETHFIECDFGPKLGRAFIETEPGFNESNVIDLITRGDMPGTFKNIYRVSLGHCDDVTDEIAQKIMGLNGPMPRDAIEWLSWCGYDWPEAAE